MPLDPFEHNIKKMAQKASEIPPNSVWENIEQELGNNKKPLLPFYFWLIFGLIGGMLLFYKVSQSSLDVKEPKLEQSITLNEQSKNAYQVEDKKQPALENRLNSELSNENNNSFKIYESEKARQLVDHKNHQNKGILKHEPRLNTPYHSIKKKQKGNIEIQKNDIQTDQSNVNENNESNENNLIDNQPQKTKNIVSRMDIYGVNPLPTLAQAAISGTKSKLIPQTAFNPNCSVFKKKRKVEFYLDLGLSAGYVIRNLSNESIDDSYRIVRDNSESPWYHWGVSLTGGVLFNRKFSLASGLQFNQIKEKFKFERNGVVRITITQYPDGRPPDTMVVSGREIHQSEIKHSMISIPVLLGYHHQKDNWSFGVEFGPVINLSTKSEGKMVFYDLSLKYIQENSNLFKTNMGIGLTGGLPIQWKAMNNLFFHVRPGVTWFPDQINSTTNPIKQKYILPSMGVGTRMIF